MRDRASVIRSIILNRRRPEFSRSGSRPAKPAVNPHGVHGRFLRRTGQGGLLPLASGLLTIPRALRIRASARVLGATLKAGETVEYGIGTERNGYLVPSSGTVEVTTGVRISARDGAAPFARKPCSRSRPWRIQNRAGGCGVTRGDHAFICISSLVANWVGDPVDEHPQFVAEWRFGGYTT